MLALLRSVVTALLLGSLLVCPALMADELSLPRKTGGGPELVELPHTGHTFEHYASLQSAFEGKQLPFDESVAQRVAEWLTAHRS